MNLLSIIWDVSPTLFKLGPFEIRWYGLLFAMAFLFGFSIITRMFKLENIPDDWADKLLIYMMLAVVLGARFGHVFFYDWDYYSQNLGEIIKIWHGGLASHGGAIGIVIALILFSKFVSKRTPLWVFDRIMVVVALGAFLIRLGNFMNSEIFGFQTDVAWGVEFVRAKAYYPLVARHPTQLYEAFSYFIVFLALVYIYEKTEYKNKPGFMFGIFLIFAFAARFLIEFLKENQEAFEDSMVLNMGQILSIPFFLAGLYFVFRKHSDKEIEARPKKEVQVSSNVKPKN